MFETESESATNVGFYCYQIDCLGKNAKEIAAYCVSLTTGVGPIFEQSGLSNDELMEACRKDGLVVSIDYQQGTLYLSFFYLTPQQQRLASSLTVLVEGFLDQPPRRWRDRGCHNYAPHGYASFTVSPEDDQSLEERVLLAQRLIAATQNMACIWQVDALFTPEAHEGYTFWENPHAAPILITTIPDVVDGRENHGYLIPSQGSGFADEEVITIAQYEGLCLIVGCEDVGETSRGLQHFGEAAMMWLIDSEELRPLWIALVLQYAKAYVDFPLRTGCVIYHLPENEAYAKELAASLANGLPELP